MAHSKVPVSGWLVARLLVFMHMPGARGTGIIHLWMAMWAQCTGAAQPAAVCELPVSERLGAHAFISKTTGTDGLPTS
jgi:hypothetical protein